MTTSDIIITVSTYLRALCKRLLAWMRDEPLVDLRLMPPDLRVAISPLVRPTVRYLTVPQAQRLIEAACALMASHERVSARQITMTKTQAALGLANAMAELAYEPAGRLLSEPERQLSVHRPR